MPETLERRDAPNNAHVWQNSNWLAPQLVRIERAILPVRGNHPAVITKVFAWMPNS
jgi:hypothetical protein